MTETELTVGELATLAQSPKVKPAPEPKSLPLQFTYLKSEDGIDENLLIMLHGLGKRYSETIREPCSPVTFTSNGHSISKSTEAVKQDTVFSRYCGAPKSVDFISSIPYLDEEAFQWYESFDSTGEILERPDPTPALDVLERVVEHLTMKSSWPINHIHLFGFAQGGSVVSELALRQWRKARDSASSFASVVSIEGPLLSFPTLKPLCSTPAVYFHRPQRANDPSVATFQKGFSDLKAVKASASAGGGMPKSKEEWSGVIQFWGRVLISRMPDIDGLHSVISGAPTLPT